MNRFNPETQKTPGNTKGFNFIFTLNLRAPAFQPVAFVFSVFFRD